MVPFGFSAGDFVALGGLIVKVGKALKDHGGAAEEYQHVVFELQKFRSIIDQVEALATNVREADGEGLSTLQELVAQSRIVLHSFLTSIEKFQDSLGEGSVKPKLSLSSNRRKAQWALFMSREVDKLRKQLNVYALYMLLQLQIMQQ
jgi:Tat protein secretion system quality control protein TatD with DNase activity